MPQINIRGLSQAELERRERTQANKILSNAPDFKVRGGEYQLQQMRNIERILSQTDVAYKRIIERAYQSIVASQAARVAQPAIAAQTAQAAQRQPVSIGDVRRRLSAFNYVRGIRSAQEQAEASRIAQAAAEAESQRQATLAAAQKRPDFSHIRMRNMSTAYGFKPIGPIAQSVAREAALAESDRLAKTKAVADAEKYYMNRIIDLDNSRFKDELDKKKLLEKAEKQTMSALVALDNKRFKEEQKRLKERATLEERGDRRIYLMAQDEQRAKERTARETERAAKKAEMERDRQERQREQRNAPLRRAAGALGLIGLRAALGQGSAEDLLSGAGEGAGALIGGAFGGPVGSAVGAAVGKLFGGMILDPFSMIEAAMKPALDYRISAARLGIAAGGGSTAGLFYSGNRIANPTLQRFGLSPQDALEMISSLGVVPRESQMLNLVSAIGGAGFSRPFANMAPGTIERTLGQGAALGFANLNDPNSVNKYLSGIGGTMEEANTKGLDRSRLLSAMQDSLETIASSGAQRADLQQVRDVFQRGIDSGMLGGRTGVLANQAIANVQELANNPFRNPAMTVRLMQELQRNNNLSTPEDVTRMLGFTGQKATDLSQAPQAMKMFEIAQKLAANPAEARRVLMPNASGNDFTQAFLASILYGGNPAQWLTYFGGGGTAPSASTAPNGAIPSRELRLQSNVANARLFASDANLGKLADAAESVAEKLDYVTLALDRFGASLTNAGGQKGGDLFHMGTGAPLGVSLLPWIDRNLLHGALSDTSTTRMHIVQ